MPKKRALCKFFAQGTCVKGAQCNYSHDRKSQVCKFFQKGMCSYGNHCKFEHVEASRFQNSVSSSSSSNSHVKPVSSRMARSQTSGIHTNLGNECGGSSTTAELANQSVCAFAAAGKCPYGENCLQRHGDLCSKRGKHCLNPYRPDERDEHLKRCQRKNKHLEMLRHSQDIECSVCLERVLSKPTPAQRKFGLLSECDHPFCISCIRNWRSNSSSSGIDVKSAVRACPVCRKVSHFVIPSGTWYSTKEEKQEIIKNYKAKLSSIDCKHFDFGNGICPFGTSCFYKHTCQPDKYPQNTFKRRNVSRDALPKVFTHVYWSHHFCPCDFVSSEESTDEEDFRDLFDVHRFYDEGVRDLLDGCMFSDGEEDLFFDDYTRYEGNDEDLFFDDDSSFEGSSMMDVACLMMMSGLTVHDSSSDDEY